MGPGGQKKNAEKLFPKYFKGRIWNFKQNMNYILMIINQNILAILRTFLNLQQNFLKRFTQRRLLPKLLLLSFLAKIQTEKKYLMNN